LLEYPSVKSKVLITINESFVVEKETFYRWCLNNGSVSHGSNQDSIPSGITKNDFKRLG
jgi:hypothetical protein